MDIQEIIIYVISDLAPKLIAAAAILTAAIPNTWFGKFFGPIIQAIAINKGNAVNDPSVNPDA